MKEYCFEDVRIVNWQIQILKDGVWIQHLPATNQLEDALKERDQEWEKIILSPSFG